ncbi:MAG: hypothetical protein IPI35_35030 [Deltaproteobacteria bacterium]|nr:hypothetical protein [Deltaproteobacteria bacterium]
MPQTPLSALIITHRGGALLARGLAALRPQLGPQDTLHVAVSNLPGAAISPPARRLARRCCTWARTSASPRRRILASRPARGR